MRKMMLIYLRRTDTCLRYCIILFPWILKIKMKNKILTGISVLFLFDLKRKLLDYFIFCDSIVLYLYFFQPEILLNTNWFVLSKAVTGNECFMCGTTRAFTELAEGNLKKLLCLTITVFIFTGFYLKFSSFIFDNSFGLL